ncbi:hypothetical protein E8F20_05980 [Pseudomonas sp. BN415]|uniref:hypothetical protein n=1 Tax=Pseudomonas sp. BN415 TaxID=2567889 RepID=UPI002458033A|nr:hypothetical protein [Pseudomonas sp. BN415]MDH4581424.1 hypothetical protein [Pseudomonas sp. BN415]
MIDASGISIREPQRAELAQLTSAFLANGGQIERLAHVERAPIRQAVWNGGITHNAENRREFLELEQQIAEHGRTLASTGLTVEQAVRQLRKRWGDRTTITAAKAEQIAARYGYAYPATARP